MRAIDYAILEEEKKKVEHTPIDDAIRDQIIQSAKDYKVSWLKLGQYLYAAWQDKLFHRWGFEKFEDYTEGELGLKKSLCTNLLKSYIFLEENDPDYLTEQFAQERPASKVPGGEEINFLRLARGRKDVHKDDYQAVKDAIFEKGTPASAARKELTALMRERKPIDPEEEKEKQSQASIMKVLHSLKGFKKDMEVWKTIPYAIVEEAGALIDKLEEIT